MFPTLESGQEVLVNRLSYVITRPREKEIIAIKDPRDKKILIKRITKIENGRLYVMGDNKSESMDSRHFGWIGKDAIIGKVIYISKHRSQISNRKTKT